MLMLLRVWMYQRGRLLELKGLWVLLLRLKLMLMLVMRSEGDGG